MTSLPPPPTITPETINQNFKVDTKLQEMLKSEQENLYDYSMRMSGNVLRSKEAVEQSIKIILQRFDTKTPYPIVRKNLFKTIRAFSQDMWNADTSNLTNQAFSGWDVKEEVFTKQEGESLDRFIHRLPATEREIVLLKSRYFFIFSDIEEIIEQSEPVQGTFEKAVKDLSSLVSKPSEATSAIISKIPNYELPPETKFHTQALSNLMLDLNNRKSFLNPSNLLMFLGILILLFIAVWILRNYV